MSIEVRCKNCNHFLFWLTPMDLTMYTNQVVKFANKFSAENGVFGYYMQKIYNSLKCPNCGCKINNKPNEIFVLVKNPYVTMHFSYHNTKKGINKRFTKTAKLPENFKNKNLHINGE